MESSERSIVPRRVAGVTVALAGAGAVLGAGLSAGLGALAGLAMRTAGVVTPGLGGSILVTAGLGAGLGAVLTPLTALSLLRQVALGKALLFTMLGMAVGVSAGQAATGRPLLAAAAGFGGFLVIALLLRMSAGRKQGGATKKGAPAKISRD